MIEFLLLILLLRYRDAFMWERNAQDQFVRDSLEPYAGIDSDESQYIRRVK